MSNMNDEFKKIYSEVLKNGVFKDNPFLSLIKPRKLHNKELLEDMIDEEDNGN